MNFWNARIYADAAAATPLSPRVKAELIRLLDVYGNAGGLHKEGVEAAREIEAARTRVAKAIGAHADEIVFVGSGTEANNLAIQGILRPLLEAHGELGAITSAIEHSSVLEPLHAMEREGLNVVELSVNSEGLVDVKELREAINEQTVFVSIQLVNSEIGVIQPIREIAKAIREERKKRNSLRSPSEAFSAGTSFFPLYFHVDASQTPLWLQLAVESLGVDLMALDAQKIMGPKGVGALYIKRGSDIEPLVYGGGQESGLRSGTPNTPLIGAFGVAMEDAAQDPESCAAQIAEVRDFCFAEIQKLIPDVIINGPRAIVREKESKAWPSGPERSLFPDYRVSNNLNISIPNLEAQMAVVALDAKGIAASTRSSCDVGSEEPSHVIKALGISPDLSGTAIRITFLPDATKAQAKHIAETLLKISKIYRKN